MRLGSVTTLAALRPAFAYRADADLLWSDATPPRPEHAHWPHEKVWGVITTTDPEEPAARPAWRYVNGWSWYLTDPARRGDALPIERGWIVPSQGPATP